VPADFHEVRPFSEGLAAVRVSADEELESRWGLIDAGGNFVVPPVYAQVGPCHNGLSVITPDSLTEWDHCGPTVTLGSSGYVDVSACLVVPAIFQGAESFSEGLAAVEIRRKWGYIDTQGHVVIPASYQFAGPFSNGLAPVCIHEKYGFIDVKGTIAIPTLFDTAREPFSEGLAPVKIDGKWGYVDCQGGLIPAVYDWAGPFHDGLAPVQINGTQGYVDRKGGLALSAVFKSAGPFGDGLAPVEIEGKCGFIDTNGALVLPAVYIWAHPFSNGIALVWTRRERAASGYIDTQGDQYWEG
jgi:hypothetical protein